MFLEKDHVQLEERVNIIDMEVLSLSPLTSNERRHRVIINNVL